MRTLLKPLSLLAMLGVARLHWLLRNYHSQNTRSLRIGI